MSLSSAQSQIVNATLERSIQVLASAGSGKTRVLTERIRFILEMTKKDGIIAVTFTNKAAEEMCERLIDCNEIEERVWISTIHSVAQRILEKYGHTIGLPMDLHIYDRDKDRMEVFMQSLRDEGVDLDSYLNIEDVQELKNREKNLQNYMNIFSTIKRKLLTEVEINNEYPNGRVWKAFQDYQRALINSGGIDYDDILVYAHQILLQHEWVAKIYRAKYKHICIDEAQDLNKIQYEFIRVLCGDSITSVLMVGDPNQMIYGFNGSSKDYLCKRFIEDFSPIQFELRENFRSTKSVIRVANKLRPNSQSEIEFALEGIVKIVAYRDEEGEAQAVVRKVQQLLKLETHDEIEGLITLDKIVVIGRNRFVFNKLEKALENNNIAYSLRKGERQLEPSTKFGKVLDYTLRLKLNPKNWVDGKKLCQVLDVTEPNIWTERTLDEIANRISSLKRDGDESISVLLCKINELNIEDPKIPKFIKELEEYLTSLVEDHSKASDQKSEELRLNLEELYEFKRAWTLFRKKGLGESLLAFRNALVLGQLSSDIKDESLTLSTVHTMKGLEKDIVFIIGMCEGVFPDYRAKTRAELDEERNNAFVAVTRAKRWLFISYPEQREMPWGDIKFQRKSRFIQEIESD